MIGDGGATAGGLVYEAAREVGKRLVDHGFRVASGGLGGVMEAAFRGAHESPKYRDGDTVAILPRLDASRANPYADIAIATDLGHLRNSIVASADAVIAVGGGAGTLCEIALAWMHGRLVVALQLPGWSGELAGRRLDDKVRHPTIADDAIRAAADASEAVRLVESLLPAYLPGPGGASLIK